MDSDQFTHYDGTMGADQRLSRAMARRRQVKNQMENLRHLRLTLSAHLRRDMALVEGFLGHVIRVRNFDPWSNGITGPGLTQHFDAPLLHHSMLFFPLGQRENAFVLFDDLVESLCHARVVNGDFDTLRQARIGGCDGWANRCAAHADQKLLAVLREHVVHE